MASATENWLDEVRRRFLAVARRRVPEDVAEDLVQDALKILVEKGVSEAGDVGPAGTPGLGYAFQVLRNVIGNHYQKDRVRRERHVAEEAAGAAVDPAPTPFESLASREAVGSVQTALRAMEKTHEACAGYLKRLLGGLTPRELARDAGVDEAVLYRRLYRCRLRLRELLAQRGIAV